MEDVEKFFIYENDVLIRPMKFTISSDLAKVREELEKCNEFTGKNFIFLLNANNSNPTEIKKGQEENFELSDIKFLKDGKSSINIRTLQNNGIKQDKGKKTPKEDSFGKNDGDFASPVRTKSVYVKDIVKDIDRMKENANQKVMPIKGSTKIDTIKKEENNLNDDEEDQKKSRILDIYQYPKIEFNPEESKKAIIILVIGETGSGKTTLINSFVNALMEVTLGYNFRYTLVYDKKLSQAHSQTQEVTMYNIKAKNGKCYKLIDTPGYGDVRGIAQDIIITQKISKFIKEKLTYINSICFVARSSSPRLTPTQKYIFHSILELFGENVASNFIAMLTFCDGESPQVLAALKEKGSIYDTVIPKVEKPWYYQFNNSAFFSIKKNDFTTNFWNLGMKSFSRFVTRLDKMSPKPLDQTKNVIDNRRKLESLLEILQNKLERVLNQITQCKREYKIINDLKKDVKDSQNYKVKVKEPKSREVKLPDGKNTTTCLYCHATCHKICYLRDDEEKKYCAAMRCGKCIYCPNKCDWTKHKNTPFFYETYEEEKEVTYEELKKKYLTSKSQIAKKKDVLNGVISKMKELNRECIQTQQQITDTINILKVIALNKEILSAEEHIDILIQVEKQEKKPGFLDRVESLNLLKKQKKLMIEAYKKEIPSLEELNTFLNDYYKNEIFI